MGDATDTGAFGKRGTFALVLFAILAFVAFLYLVGQGGLSGQANNGRAHAASNGLTGFAGLTRLLEADGTQVDRSRNRAALDDPGLLILTPPQQADAEELAEIVDRRRTIGPTMVIAPKWFAMPAGDQGKEPGWVRVVDTADDWSFEIDGQELEFSQTEIDKGPPQWQGLSHSGSLPDDTFVASLEATDADGFLSPIVTDDENHVLAAYLADDGSYLDGDLTLDPMRNDGRAIFGMMLVAEPDLLNNWGMADEARASLALELVQIARQGTDGPVRFDLTMNGLGGSRNLLTLAFEPPFLAATLTLLLALAIAFWRAFARFGPALRPTPAIAPGKSQLVANGAQVIARSRRLRLLGKPYAALVRARIARRLGLKDTDSEAIDAALAARGAADFENTLQTMRGAKGGGDILRAARSLRDIERTL